MKRLPFSWFRNRPIASRLVSVIAAGLLTIALTPAAAGVSLIAEVSEVAVEDADTDSPPPSLRSSARSVEDIQFQEQNWDVGVREAPISPTASAIAQDEFSIMEQYPGAYTKPGTLNSRLGEGLNDFRFIEENLFLPGSDATTADSLRESVGNDQENVHRPRGAGEGWLGGGATTDRQAQAPSIDLDRSDRTIRGPGEGWLGGGATTDRQAQAPSIDLDRSDRIAGLRAGQETAQWSTGDYRDLELNAVSTSTRSGSASFRDSGEITEQNQLAFTLARDAAQEPVEDFSHYRFIEENTIGLPGSSLEPHAPWEEIQFQEDNVYSMESGTLTHPWGGDSLTLDY